MIRDTFWTIKSRELSRKISQRSLDCIKFRPITAKPIMGDLPVDRVMPSSPFTVSGVAGFYSCAETLPRVRSVKHVKRVLTDLKLAFEGFSTLLAQIEDMLNSCFLCPLSYDPHNFSDLTPAHFLYLKNSPHPHQSPERPPCALSERQPAIRAIVADLRSPAPASPWQIVPAVALVALLLGSPNTRKHSKKALEERKITEKIQTITTDLSPMRNTVFDKNERCTLVIDALKVLTRLKTIKFYRCGSVGIYSTEHEPSRLSLHVIFASEGPSIARERPPVPASLVSTVNWLGLFRIPFSNPGPYAQHFFASQPLRTFTTKVSTPDGFVIVHVTLPLSAGFDEIPLVSTKKSVGESTYTPGNNQNIHKC
nr:unnamed protein product [Callosobruchus analis]